MKNVIVAKILEFIIVAFNIWWTVVYIPSMVVGIPTGIFCAWIMKYVVGFNLPSISKERRSRRLAVICCMIAGCWYAREDYDVDYGLSEADGIRETPRPGATCLRCGETK
jgi:hypothetical protein